MNKMNKSQDITAVFDKDLYLYFYVDSINEANTQAQCDLILRELSNSSRILDLACGHGRHAKKFAQQGHRVVGLDLNPVFIKMAREEALSANLSIDYSVADMRSIRFENEFDLITLLFTSFGYFNDEENEQLVSKISSALKIGGKFILDIMNYERILKNAPFTSVLEKGEDFMLDKVSFDKTTHRALMKRIYCKDDAISRVSFSLRLYKRDELEEVLNKFNFKIKNIYGNWNADKYVDESARLIIIAEKTG